MKFCVGFLGILIPDAHVGVEEAERGVTTGWSLHIDGSDSKGYEERREGEEAAWK